MTQEPKTMEGTFKTINKNVYLYAQNGCSFHYIPNCTLLEGRDDSFLKTINGRRELLWDNYSLLKEVKPDFITSYSPQHIKENLSNLKQLVIEVTDGCNLSCKYCGYGELYKNYDKRENKNQTFNNVKPLIDYLCQMWVSQSNISHNNDIIVGFYGGEPLLNFKLISEVISYLEALDLSSIKFKFNMTTNAVLLGKYMDYLVEKKFHLLISLDGNIKNDSYRVSQNDKPSFDIVVANTLELKKKYPDFFEKNVSFNTVLHNRNSVEEAVSYIWKTFGKIPEISELNTNEITEDKREEFRSMFIDKFDSFDNALNCGKMPAELSTTSPKVLMLNSFLDAFTDNTYHSYYELFTSTNKCQYMPTGTCSPFSRKLFLTVNGKILPCEKIGQYIALGYVRDEKVEIDFEEISEFYKKKYEQLIYKCSDCLQWKNCGLCIYYMKEKDGKLFCPAFRSRKAAANAYFSEFISLMENDNSLYKKAMNDITID